MLNGILYLCLFTCATTRTIHLEIVADMSLPTLIIAFSARNSLPKLTMDDMTENATIYLTAAEKLKKLFESPELKEILHRQNLHRKFTAKRAHG